MAFKTKFDGTTSKTYALGTPGNPTSIEGYYIGTKTTQSDYGEGKLHVFQTEEGHIGVWGKTRLNTLLTDDLRGQMVRVTFTGMIEPSKKGRRPSYGFKVEHDDENTTDVANVDMNAKEPTENDDVDYDLDSDGDSDGDSLLPSRPQAPKNPAAPPSAERQARIQAMLNKSRTS